MFKEVVIPKQTLRIIGRMSSIIVWHYSKGAKDWTKAARVPAGLGVHYVDNLLMVEFGPSAAALFHRTVNGRNVWEELDCNSILSDGITSFCTGRGRAGSSCTPSTGSPGSGLPCGASRKRRRWGNWLQQEE